MSEPTAKSKSQLRAERRALQEAQRAAKLAVKKGKTKKPEVSDENKSDRRMPPQDKKHVEPSNVTESVPQSLIQPSLLPPAAVDLSAVPHRCKSFPAVPSRKSEPNRVHLFRHLREPDKRSDIVSDLGLGTHSPIHPSFIALGINLDEGRIWGANETCLHFIAACESLIHSQHHPPSASMGAQDRSLFARHFGPVLQRHFDFLAHCRPPTVTIRNTYQYLKQTLNQLDSVDDWEECRARLLSAIDEFRQQSIYLAGAEIAEGASKSIRPGECVCTFGYSSVVARVFLRAWSASAGHRSDYSTADQSGQDKTMHDHGRVFFSVLVVDSRPRFKGRRMLARLTQAGIPCEYTHIGALPCLAHKVSLAIVGADALLNNGYVLADIGTAQVANIVWTVARAPTLVCAETYKFWERAHSDAFEFNELGDPDDIWRGPRGVLPEFTHGLPGCSPAGLTQNNNPTLPDLSDWRSNTKLRLLQLTYDVLPPVLVSAVVTEKGTLPTTSVPVVLRVKQASAVTM